MDSFYCADLFVSVGGRRLWLRAELLEMYDELLVSELSTVVGAVVEDLKAYVRFYLCRVEFDPVCRVRFPF